MTASTIGLPYYAHQRIARSVDKSRQISRFARTAYVMPVERELSLINDSAARSASKAAAKFAVTMDSLVEAAGNSPEGSSHIAGIENARTQWNASI